MSGDTPQSSASFFMQPMRTFIGFLFVISLIVVNFVVKILMLRLANDLRSRAFRVEDDAKIQIVGKNTNFVFVFLLIVNYI